MFNDTVVQIAVIGLAALSVGMIVYVLILPYLSGEKQAEKRVRSVAARRTKARGARASREEEHSARRKNVQQTLQELERKQKQKNSVPLRTRIVRAGLSISVQQFYMFSLGLGAAAGIGAFLGGLQPVICAAIAFVAGLGLPRWLLGHLMKRRQNKFLNEFANTIDVVVRGVKSGLPLNECLEIIARESPEPIRSEFRELIEQQRVGVPLADCFERMMRRMPLPEVNFFAIVVAIQQSAGGNLAEALGNLSGVLRARKMLKAKVKALSAEANASAMILAALPFTVMGMTYFSAPDYISLLWNDKTGHMLLAGGGVWMTLGILVMRKMINFKY
ncbi:MAG: hypothetical protein GC150_00620 [Rhizobiales bacterium]|nr:hypothetical protein [Hyphomicrobiales bacterium]